MASETTALRIGLQTQACDSLATKITCSGRRWTGRTTSLPCAGATAAGGVDVLQGVRVGTASTQAMVARRSDTAYKGLVSVVNYLVIRGLFRLPLGDYQNVTVYPRRLIQSVALETESSFTNAECLLKTWWRGATFREVPVPFVKRERGKGTGTRPRAIFAAIRDILGWWVQGRLKRRAIAAAPRYLTVASRSWPRAGTGNSSVGLCPWLECLLQEAVCPSTSLVERCLAAIRREGAVACAALC